MSDQKICPTCSTEYPLSERFCPRDGTALRSASVQADLLGSIVADRYHVLKKLGEGGMGTVYLAEHVKMGRKSALKVMNPGMDTDPDAIARFNREASNASRLSHPNICGIYDFGETPEGLIYLAMEFVEGSSLTSLIEKAGSIPASRAASIIHQTADALQVAHDAGIVHRDLKPDNIMIAKNRDGSDLVKVVDFGIAKASSSDAQKVTKTGLVVGTPEYMSPEQLAGDKLDGRSDIYSLGLVAFNCLTGMLPFAAESAQEAMIMRLTDRPRSLAEVKPAMAWPEPLQNALSRALARDTNDRYKNASEFGRDFAAAIADMPATQAVEAGTMVMGAAGAAASAAAGQPVPSTRVGRPSSAATLAMEAPPKGARKRASAPAPVAAAKKSSMPMVLGGAGGLALVAVAAWQFGLVGGTKPSAQPSLPGSAPTAPNRDTTQKNPSETGETTMPRTDRGTKSVPDGSAGKASGGTKMLDPSTNSPSTKPPTNPPGRPAGDATTQPTPPSAGSRLEGWLAEVQAANVNKMVARRVLGDVEALQSSLSGSQLAESHYVAMIANTVLEDESATCRSAREVKKLHRDPSRISNADLVLGGCP